MMLLSVKWCIDELSQEIASMCIPANFTAGAGFHWKRASEAKHPVTQKQADVLLQEPINDTAAAIAAAAGGCGLLQEAQ